jgi:WD40 repeat protein
LCSASEDKTLIIWDMQTFQKVATLNGHRHNVSSVAYSPCGRFICSSSFDKTIKIWDNNGIYRYLIGNLIGSCIGHNDGVSSVCYDSENR